MEEDLVGMEHLEDQVPQGDDDGPQLRVLALQVEVLPGGEVGTRGGPAV